MSLGDDESIVRELLGVLWVVVETRFVEEEDSEEFST